METDGNLPEVLQRAINDTARRRCRLVWVSRVTGHIGAGPWFSLASEGRLTQGAAEANRLYNGLLDHWVDYV